MVLHAQDILSKSGHPKWTPITHVNEDAEPPLFKEQVSVFESF